MNRRQLIAATASASGLQLLGCASQTPAMQHARVSAPELPKALQRIAFGSCIDQNKPQPLWAQIIADKPDLFVFGGDNVYASKQPFDIANTQVAYAALAANEGFARLRATVPHMAIWDDHDYGLNDGGVAFAHKQATKEAFLNFWNISANDERRGREGIYHAASYGPTGQRVQIVLLDNRSFLSPWKPTDARNAAGKERYVPDTDASKTILGDAQWTWLEAQLKQSADVRIIVSGIQVLAEGHGWERWGLFPTERQKLYNLIASTRANGVMFVSGDRHIGALYKENTNTPYVIHEMTSSGMTHPWKDAQEAGPNRLDELLTELHYGMVEFDWVARAVKLQLRDAKGAVRRELVVRLADLEL